MDLVSRRPIRAASSMFPVDRYKAVEPPALSECSEYADGFSPCWKQPYVIAKPPDPVLSPPPTDIQDANALSLYLWNLTGRKRRNFKRPRTGRKCELFSCSGMMLCDLAIP